MSALVTDTHALLWYVNDAPELSTRAAQAFEQAEQTNSIVYASAISLVEIRYLVEKGRDVTEADYQAVVDLLTDTHSPLMLAPLDFVTADTLSQIPRATVPDMPDRIIAVTALVLGLPLVTRDSKIRALSNIITIW